jgi:hypothetical protein
LLRESTSRESHSGRHRKSGKCLDHAFQLPLSNDNGRCAR